MIGRLLTGLALVGVLALPSPASARYGAFQDAPASETTPAKNDARFDGPEARVAAMVREALRTPENTEAWRCLDLALSEMNAPVGNGQELNSQAQRDADSLACPNGSVYWTASSSAFPPTRPGGPEGNSWSSESPNGAWQRVLPTMKNMWLSLIENPWIFPVLLLLSSGVLIWFGRATVLELLSTRNGLGTRSAPDTPQRGPENPVAMALALWEGGLPSPEIARRTGLAQDALSVLLNLKVEHTPVAAGGPDPQAAPNPYSQTRVERG